MPRSGTAGRDAAGRDHKAGRGPRREDGRRERGGEAAGGLMAGTVEFPAPPAWRPRRRCGGCGPKGIAHPAREGGPNGGIPGRGGHRPHSGGRRNGRGAGWPGAGAGRCRPACAAQHRTQGAGGRGCGGGAAQKERAGEGAFRLRHGGWRFIAHTGGASRFAAGFGALDAAAGRRALRVPGRAAGDHSRPASVPAGRLGGPVLRSGPGSRRRGETEFGEVARPCTRHAPARIGRPRAGGRQGQLRGELRRGLRRPAGAPRGLRAQGDPHELRRGLRRPAGAPHRGTARGPPAGRVGGMLRPSRPADPAAGLIKQHSRGGGRTSPSRGGEAPARALPRNAPPRGAGVVADRQAGSGHRPAGGAAAFGTTCVRRHLPKF